MDRIIVSGFTVADAAVALLFLIFAVWKGRRGFYQSFMPFVVGVCAFVGALFLSRLLREAVTDWVWPLVQRRLSEKLDLESVRLLDAGSITAALERLLPERLLLLAEKLGLDLSGYVAGAMGAADQGARQVASDAATALLRGVTEEAVRIGLFLLFWGVLALLLTGLKNVLGLAFRLPIIHGLDTLLGAALGLFQCALILYLLLWAAYGFKIGFLLDLSRSSRILSWLAHL